MSPIRSFRPSSTPGRKVLLAWLLVTPFILSTLVCGGQVALMLYHAHHTYPVADTRSWLQADYGTWPYLEIPAIDIAAFMESLQQEQPGGLPVLVEAAGDAIFLLGPTHAATRTTGVLATPTRTLETASPTASQTATPTFTGTLPLTATPLHSLTYTPLPPPPPIPTATQAPPPPAATATKALPPSPTPTPRQPSSTPVTPSPTGTNTPETPPTEAGPPTPTYAPVRPIAENNGMSDIDPDGQGCQAFFGYRNDNPVEVDIPLGERNYFSQPYVLIDPAPPPTHFELERVSPAFLVVWNTGEPFTWFLDGRTATANWCAWTPP